MEYGGGNFILSDATPANTNATPAAGTSVNTSRADHVHTSAGECPIGTILPWAKSLTGTPALTGTWAECDGSTVSDAASPYNGVALPNMNGNAQIPYGAATSGSTKTEDFLPVHTHTASCAAIHYSGENVGGGTAAFQLGTASPSDQTGQITTPAITVNNTSATGTAWKGYSVVFIIRIK